MRKKINLMVSLVLVVAITLSLAACGNVDKTWAAEKNNLKLPIGGYIYYLEGAFSAAAEKVAKEEDILKATIEEKDAESWIRNEANENIKAFFALEDKFSELGLELTDGEIEQAKSTTAGVWPYYKTFYEDMGISQDSFTTVYSLYSIKYKLVFDKVYSKGGEHEVSDDDVKTFFENSFIATEAFKIPTVTTDAEGNEIAMEEEARAEIKANLDTYLTKVNQSEMTVAEAAADFETTYNIESAGYIAENTFSTDIESTQPDKMAALSLSDGESEIVDNETEFYFVRKVPITEKTEEVLEDEFERLTVIARDKAEHFKDYMKDLTDKVDGIRYNEDAMNSIKLSALKKAEARLGTSEVSSESSDLSSGSGSEVETSSSVDSSESSAEISESSAESEPSSIASSKASSMESSK